VRSVSTGASQSLKHLVFDQEQRPSAVYDNLSPVDGLERHKNNSFPSGHTTAAFTFFTILAVSVRKKWVQILAAFSALLVGISRIYLGQHYLNDVVTGAVLGLLLSSMIIFFIREKSSMFS